MSGVRVGHRRRNLDFDGCGQRRIDDCGSRVFLLFRVTEKPGGTFVIHGKIACHGPFPAIQLLRYLKIRTRFGARCVSGAGNIRCGEKNFARCGRFVDGELERRSEFLGIQSKFVVFGNSGRIVGIGIPVRSGNQRLRKKDRVGKFDVGNAEDVRPDRTVGAGRFGGYGRREHADLRLDRGFRGLLRIPREREEPYGRKYRENRYDHDEFGQSEAETSKTECRHSCT